MTTKHIEGAETIRALKAQIEALTADNLGWFHLSKKLEKERDAAMALAADRLVDAERYQYAALHMTALEVHGIWMKAFEKTDIDKAIDAARAAS